MADSQEVQIGGLTVRIDRLLCVGFGDCIEYTPETFEFDPEGIAVFRPEAKETSRERLLESCRLCPVEALVVLDPEGNQLVP